MCVEQHRRKIACAPIARNRRPARRAPASVGAESRAICRGDSFRRPGSSSAGSTSLAVLFRKRQRSIISLLGNLNFSPSFPATSSTMKSEMIQSWGVRTSSSDSAQTPARLIDAAMSTDESRTIFKAYPAPETRPSRAESLLETPAAVLCRSSAGSSSSGTRSVRVAMYYSAIHGMWKIQAASRRGGVGFSDRRSVGSKGYG